MTSVPLKMKAILWALQGSFALAASSMIVVPLAKAYELLWLWLPLDLPYRIVCHRKPERVLLMFGQPMPLCSRCFGLYGGFVLGVLIGWPKLQIHHLRIATIASACLMIAEVVTQDMGLHPVFHPTRIATGLLFSVPLGAALTRIVTEETRREFTKNS